MQISQKTAVSPSPFTFLYETSYVNYLEIYPLLLGLKVAKCSYIICVLLEKKLENVMFIFLGCWSLLLVILA